MVIDRGARMGGCTAMLMMLCAVRAVHAQEQTPAAEAEPAAAAARVVLATVDGAPIYAHQVERAVARAVGERELTDEARQHLAEEVLELLVKRRLALDYLTSRGLAASDDDIALALARLERGLAEQRLTLAEFLEASGLTEEELRERYAWEIGWGRFVERQLTDENLEAFFQPRRRQFDGTELRVAHILLVPADDSEAARQDALAEAAALREQIAAGELAFAEAARQHSAAPTAEEGGELGWISRHAPMPESFSAAAFALEPGEISPPVLTTFGVHLIECQEVKPGERSWDDAREELVPAVTEYLLEWTSGQQRPQAVVEYTGEVAYGGE